MQRTRGSTSITSKRAICGAAPALLTNYKILMLLFPPHTDDYVRSRKKLVLKLFVEQYSVEKILFWTILKSGLTLFPVGWYDGGEQTWRSSAKIRHTWVNCEVCIVWTLKSYLLLEMLAIERYGDGRHGGDRREEVWWISIFEKICTLFVHVRQPALVPHTNQFSLHIKISMSDNGKPLLLIQWFWLSILLFWRRFGSKQQAFRCKFNV